VPCSRMEPRGRERHGWTTRTGELSGESESVEPTGVERIDGKPTGRNERERMSQDFRSLNATPFPFAPELKPLACVGSTAVLGSTTAFTFIENGRQL
jgi:hypothetical protein